ncbi:hypothetical protein DFH06DRAFT_1338273 [Mycena polygramma]|nr:hypothetical protein DFH06DRAFT_1338273 [Mycena polygramma]
MLSQTRPKPKPKLPPANLFLPPIISSTSQVTSLGDLPLELIELIIEEVGNRLQDILSCSLVCRAWLPFARSRLPIRLSPYIVQPLLNLLQSPRATLLSTIRQITLDGPTGSEAHLALLQLLPTFTRLRTLDVYCTFRRDLPSLPQLTELRLSGTLFSYTGFINFMSALPVLQSLALSGVGWGDHPDPQLTFPTLQLERLSLDWGRQEPNESIMLSLRTRRLQLIVRIREEIPYPAYQRGISRYLHSLGGHLQYFQFNCISSQHLCIPSSLDFSRSTGLRRLSIEKAVRYSMFADFFEASVSLHIMDVLTNLPADASLESLTLGVSRKSNKPSWIALSQFAGLLATPQFAALREIRFVIDRAFREDFRSRLSDTMRGCSARIAICAATEDPYDIEAIWH